MNTCVVTLTNSIVEFHWLIKFKVCLTVTLGENIFHDYFVQNGLRVKLYDEIVIQSSPVAQVHFNFPPSLNVDIKNIFRFV